MTVTQLRRYLFDVMEATKVNKQITNVMLHGELIAEIRPKTEDKVGWEQQRDNMRNTRKKLLKNFDFKSVEKARMDSKKERFTEW